MLTGPFAWALGVEGTRACTFTAPEKSGGPEDCQSCLSQPTINRFHVWGFTYCQPQQPIIHPNVNPTNDEYDHLSENTFHQTIHLGDDEFKTTFNICATQSCHKQ